MNKRRILPRLTAVLFAIALAVIGAEVGLRLTGRSPAPTALDVTVVPAGAHMYQPHAQLGYALVPDQRLELTFNTVFDGHKLSFVTTTNSRGHRITHMDTSAASDRDEVWIMGCSLTFGWSVNDADTYPWLLQATLPEFEFVNFGVGGYGTLQSLIQLESEFASASSAQRRPPKLIVLLHGKLHEQRNVLSPRRRRDLGVAWIAWGEREQPFVTWQGEGELDRHNASVAYQPVFPLTHSSVVFNCLESVLVSWRDRQVEEVDHRREIAQRLVESMDRLARAHGTTLLVVQRLEPGEPPGMVEFCERKGIPAFPLRLRTKDADDPSMTNLPFDGHPSARGHAFVAQALLPVLTEALKHQAR